MVIVKDNANAMQTIVSFLHSIIKDASRYLLLEGKMVSF